MIERLILICIFIILCFVSESIGRKGFGPGEQEWGFVQVRPGANMFWWLYYTTANENYYDHPLIIWLQGGPGLSSTAIGNFKELGPLDTDLNPRNYTWVKDYNVLFIDSPVGTGFSNVKTTLAFVTSTLMAAFDLLSCIIEFYEDLPKFKPVPTYIVGQSYGGKIGVEFALVWYQAQKQGIIESNLKGVAMGNAWISPLEQISSSAPFLLNMGIIDTEDSEKINRKVRKIEEKVAVSEWLEAVYYLGVTTSIIEKLTSNVDPYNILTRKNYTSNYLPWQKMLSPDAVITQPLASLMNGPVKEALGLDVIHGIQAEQVYIFLMTEFLQPVTSIVEQLLNETDLKVFVYNGQLDLTTTTLGTLRWVEKLKWKYTDHWKTSTRFPLLSDNDVIEGYQKFYDRFSMYWVERAGHQVPADNPAAMKEILRDLMENNA